MRNWGEAVQLWLWCTVQKGWSQPLSSFFLQKDIFLSGHLITDDTLSVVLQEVVWVALHVDVVLLRIKKKFTAKHRWKTLQKGAQPTRILILKFCILKLFHKKRLRNLDLVNQYQVAGRWIPNNHPKLFMPEGCPFILGNLFSGQGTVFGGGGGGKG